MNGKRYVTFGFISFLLLLLALASCTEDTGRNSAPAAAFTATPKTGAAPLEVFFDAAGSSGAVGYAWDFGDGARGEGVKVSHTYRAVGTYTAALTVTDGEGRTARETLRVVVASASESNRAPRAAFIPTPQTGAAPLEVTFDASGSSDPDGDTLSHTWNFGDGEAGKGVTVRHVYASAGSYVVTLKVEDGRGGSDSSQRTVQVSAPAPAFTKISWSTVAPQPLPNSEAQGLVLDGKLYSFGGFDETKTPSVYTPTDRAYVYDPTTNAWTALKEMPRMQGGTVPGGTTHTGTATDGTDIYFAGGYTANQDGTGQIFGTSEVWKYNVSENTYEFLPSLPRTPDSGPANRHSAGQLEVLNGKLHFFGGTSADREKDVGYHFVLDLSDLAAGWAAAAPLPNPRHHMGSTVLGGKIYAVGGQHGHDEALVPEDEVGVYDPAADAWTELSSLARPRNHISSATFVMGGRIIVAGGQLTHTNAVADVSAYDPGTNTWTELTPLPARRFSGVAGAIDGLMYYATGSASATTFRGAPQPQ